MLFAILTPVPLRVISTNTFARNGFFSLSFFLSSLKGKKMSEKKQLAIVEVEYVFFSRTEAASFKIKSRVVYFCQKVSYCRSFLQLRR